MPKSPQVEAFWKSLKKDASTRDRGRTAGKTSKNQRANHVRPDQNSISNHGKRKRAISGVVAKIWVPSGGAQKKQWENWKGVGAVNGAKRGTTLLPDEHRSGRKSKRTGKRRGMEKVPQEQLKDC